MTTFAPFNKMQGLEEKDKDEMVSKMSLYERITKKSSEKSRRISQSDQNIAIRFGVDDVQNCKFNPTETSFIHDHSLLSKRSDETSLRSGGKKPENKFDYRNEKMPVIVGILTVILFILGGAVLFAVWEGWNIFDGAYFSFITLTTIGFGDMVPGKSLDSESQEKLIICSLYLLFGMALIAMCFKLMQDDVVQKTRWLGEKIGILVKEESWEDEEDDEEGNDEEDRSGFDEEMNIVTSLEEPLHPSDDKKYEDKREVPSDTIGNK